MCGDLQIMRKAATVWINYDLINWYDANRDFSSSLVAFLLRVIVVVNLYSRTNKFDASKYLNHKSLETIARHCLAFDGVFRYPRQEGSHSSVDAWILSFTATNSPRNDANLSPSAVVDDHWTWWKCFNAEEKPSNLFIHLLSHLSKNLSQLFQHKSWTR